MDAGYRQVDVKRLGELTAAFRDSVYGAQPGLSVEQIAAYCSRGNDDPMDCSADTLRKVLEAQRKFPAHKIGRLVEVTQCHRVIETLAHHCRGWFVRRPPVTLCTADLASVVRATSEVLARAAEALADDRVTPEEAEGVSDAVERLVPILLELEAAFLRRSKQPVEVYPRM